MFINSRSRSILPQCCWLVLPIKPPQTFKPIRSTSSDWHNNHHDINIRPFYHNHGSGQCPNLTETNLGGTHFPLPVHDCGKRTILTCERIHGAIPCSPPTKATIVWGDTTPPRDFPYNPLYYLSAISTFISVPSELLCDDPLPPNPVKVCFGTQPYLATYFPHPNPEKKKTSINNILQQPQKTYHHMIHTSHQHWNPEIHHAISTGNPPPLLRPSWNYYWNCWRTQRWDPFWDLPWSHLLRLSQRGIGHERWGLDTSTQVPPQKKTVWRALNNLR